MKRINSFVIFLVMACGQEEIEKEEQAVVEEPANEASSEEIETDPCEDSDIQTVVLSEQEQIYLLPVYPELNRKRVIEIPEEFLHSEFDDYFNTYILELYNDTCEKIGYAREITTEVGCVTGVCLPIHYYECLDADGVHLDVYSALEGKDLATETDELYFRKYWEEHIIFNEQDMVLTRSLIEDPPDAYRAVTDAAELVEGLTSTAPTVPEFIDITVRGGVFTIWIMIHYRDVTEEIVIDMQ